MKRPDMCFQHDAGPNPNGSYEDHVMASKALPSPEVLRQLLRYDPETGKLFWLPRSRSMFSSDRSQKTWNTRNAGKEAGLSDPASYMRVTIFGKTYLAHRICWALHHGKWPENHIDHINGVKHDNRIVNLRDCTNSENSKNSKLPANNTSGVCGVTWDARHGYWKAQGKSLGVNYNLGSFATKSEAIEARAAFNSAHGFSDRHGEIQ